MDLDELKLKLCTESQRDEKPPGVLEPHSHSVYHTACRKSARTPNPKPFKGTLTVLL